MEDEDDEAEPGAPGKRPATYNVDAIHEKLEDIGWTTEVRVGNSGGAASRLSGLMSGGQTVWSPRGLQRRQVAGRWCQGTPSRATPCNPPHSSASGWL